MIDTPTDSTSVALYGHWICPFATRVAFSLHQRGISHDVVDLPPSAVRGPDFDLPTEFVEHSPRSEIPMLRVGEEYWVDSIPILELLEEVVPHRPLLPSDEQGRALVRARVAWIDRHAFRAMVGVCYGVDPGRIAAAGDLLAAALAEMGSWTHEGGGWLAGHDVTLAEAVAIPIHVRMEGLQRLGFTAEVSPQWVAHGERCRELLGWEAVEWSTGQTDEFVGRFQARRRKRRR